jgi:hypothetical protein
MTYIDLTHSPIMKRVERFFFWENESICLYI